jgi:hypothetical protein
LKLIQLSFQAVHLRRSVSNVCSAGTGMMQHASNSGDSLRRTCLSESLVVNNAIPNADDADDKLEAPARKLPYPIPHTQTNISRLEM